jgi:UDP-N-acetylmuramoylalanine--D-glutamate ligase
MNPGIESLAGKKALVVGLARTGLDTANFMAAEGCSVTVSEALRRDDLTVDPGLLDRSVELELGGHRRETFMGADLIVPSPGVPRDLGLLQEAASRGVPVQSEIEMASRMIEKPLLATTGTNGKSTVVSLLGAMLTRGGVRAPVVGNIGRPLISMVGREEEYDCLVVEVSSFQLEWVRDFHPRTAALLNVTEDHLDRYRDFRDYLETKLRIASRLGPDDSLVLNRGDENLRELAGSTRARVVWFSRGETRNGLFLDGDGIFHDLAGSGSPEHLLSAGDLKLEGIHNLENVMAAAAQAMLFGVGAAAVREAACNFTGLSHRSELVAEVDGVRYIDDSKATNVGAVKKSLEGFTEPVILIAGGREKGAPYTPLAGEVSQKVKLLIVIGEARQRMVHELRDSTETLEADSIEDAVCLAGERARPGDVILLSPACSSFDMFRDYKERGVAFRKAVGRMPCRGR